MSSIACTLHKPLHQFRNILTPMTVARLSVTWASVIVFGLYGTDWLSSSAPMPNVLTGSAALFGAILFASFGVVKEADRLAAKLGEPYGALILTLSIVSIEVILIAAVMLGPGETATIGRDAVFAVMMVIMNLVVGLCILFGSAEHYSQEYNAQGSIAYLSMILVLGGLGFILPRTLGVADGSFSAVQSAAFALITILVYAAFLVLQAGKYRQLFVQPFQRIVEGSRATAVNTPEDGGPAVDTETILRTTILIVLALPIVLLSHHLAGVIDIGIERFRMPAAVGGVLIAIIVFTPESIAAVKAASSNEMQRANNLCLGAFVSTVGLTVPAVLAIGLLLGKQVVLGLDSTDMCLAILTLLLSGFTFLGHRTTPIQGILHLALFAVFVVTLITP